MLKTPRTPVLSEQKLLVTGRGWVYYVVQMLLSFGQNLSYQFMPILVRKLGANPTQMALQTSFSNIFSNLFSPIFGSRSDKYGRRMYLTGGALILTGAGVGIAVSQTVFQILFASALSAFGLSIFMPAWSGALADFTEGKNRGGFIGRIMGVGSAFVTICLTLFAFLSYSLPYDELTQFRLIMYISAINFLVVTIFSYIYLDTKIVKKSQESQYSMFSPLGDHRFRRALFVVLTWWLFMSFAWSFFPLVINDVLEMTVAQIAWIGIAQTVVQAFSSYRGGDLIDKMGAKKSLIIGFLPFTFIPFLYAFSTQWWHLFLPQLIGGLGIGFGFAALQVYILNLAGHERAGTYQGVYNVFLGIVTFFGSLAGGIFLQYYSEKIGSLSTALFHGLLVIAALRFLSNFLMFTLLPDDRD